MPKLTFLRIFIRKDTVSYNTKLILPHFFRIIHKKSEIAGKIFSHFPAKKLVGKS